MKTLEQKAKAYDEALERARMLNNGKDVDVEAGTTTCEYIFPELKESEDERTRQMIKNTLQSAVISEYISETSYRKMSAYLEKQKEASKAIEAVEKIDKYIDEHLINAHDMKDSNPDKRYYSGWDDALGEIAGILQDVYSEEKKKEPEKISFVEKLRERLSKMSWDELDELIEEYERTWQKKR